jgi:hypothetical protein
MRVFVLLCCAAAVVGLSFAYGAASTPTKRVASVDTAPVTDLAGLRKALDSVAPGGTIHLGAATFGQFTLQGHRYAQPVTIVGVGPTTVMNGINIFGSSNVVFENLRFAPAGRIATVNVDTSSDVRFSHVVFDGQDEHLGANLQAQSKSTGVSVADSTFTLCGSGRACVLAHGTGVSVLRSSFDQLIDSDGVRGAGSNVTITGNTFNHALRGSDGNHNDFVQILGGGPWSITRNKFGERAYGGGQVFLKPANGNGNAPIHDVTVASNIFYGNMPFAMQVGPGNGLVPPASNVSIVNNTILSGTAGAIRLVPELAQLPVEQRPVIANNIEAVNKSGYCAPLARATSKNLVMSGQPCPGDLTGDASLGAAYQPTRTSVKVIGQADPQYAPATDYYGHPHGVHPDIGAIYFGAPAPPPGLAVKAAVSVRLASLAKLKWRLTLRAQPHDAAKLTGKLSRGASVLATGAKKLDPAAAKTVALTVVLPQKARKPGVLKFLWTAFGADGHTVQRTTTVRLTR